MSHNIILNEGDEITEGAIQTLLGRSASSGYVERGVGITYHEDGTVDVEPGEVHILDPGRGDITVETDAFVGHDLVANAENTLWIVVDPSAATDDGAVSLRSNATGVSPSEPSIEIAAVDTTKPPQDPSAVQPSNRGTAAALEGEDLNPRSIGREKVVLEVVAETIRATGGSITGLDDLSATTVSGATGDFGSTNGVYHLDPDTDDFGAALNDVLDDMDEGDVAIVPPVEYAGPHTPVVINTQFVTIRSQRITGRDNFRQAVPRVVSDVAMDEPFIKTRVNCAIAGITFAKPDAPADGQAGIEAHKPVFLDGIIGARLTGPPVWLYNDGSAGTDNVNNSRVQNVSGYKCDADVVEVSKTPGATLNVNGLRIHVLTAQDCSGWAVNFDAGFGNIAMVDHAASGLGAIRFNGNESYGEITYCGDGINHAAQFDEAKNMVGLIHAAASDERIVMNNPNNSYQWLWPRDGIDWYSGYRDITLGRNVSVDGGLTVGRGGGSEGWALRGASGYDNSLIIPRINGEEKFANRITFGNETYRTNASIFPKGGLTLTSPDGTEYEVVVQNDGTLVAQ